MNLNVLHILVKNYILGTQPFENLIQLPHSKKTDSKLKKVFLNIFRIFIMICLAFSFMFLAFNTFYGYMMMGKILNLAQESIGVCIFLATIAILFFEGIYLEFIIFSGKDINLWKTYPITNSEFIFGRLIISYLYSLLSDFIFTIPLIVSVFMIFGFSIYKLIVSIILLFLIPIFPILIGLILSTIKMSILKGKVSKTFDFLFSNLPFIAIILFFSKISTQFSMMSGSVTFETIAPMYQKMFSSLGTIVYAKNIAKAFFNPIDLFVFLAFIFVSFIVVALILKRPLQKCLSYEIREISSKKRKNQNLKSSTKLTSLVKREFDILLSDRSFIIEGFSEIFIPVILIGVWALTGSLSNISNVVTFFSNESYFPLIILGLVELFSMFSMISSTSVSREGRLFKMNKILPVNEKDLINAKLVFHILFMALIQIIYLLIFFQIFSIDFKLLFWMIPFHILVNSLISLVGLSIDYRNPYINWEIAQKAMKQNLNGVFSMLVNLILVGSLFALLYFLPQLKIVSFILLLIYLFVFYKIAISNANKALCAL